MAAILYIAVRADILPSTKCLDVSHHSFLNLNSVQLSIFPVPLSSSCSLSNIHCLAIGFLSYGVAAFDMVNIAKRMRALKPV